jgi:predicted hydrolase (HD superfamily)
VAWLREQGEPEIAQAVVAHFDPSEVAELTALDKSLLACDELTGFVMACSLVRPEGIRTLSPSSVKKKLKDKSFAAKVKREDVYSGVERLGVPLDEHIQLVIDALSPLADELGIAGTAAGPPATS